MWHEVPGILGTQQMVANVNLLVANNKNQKAEPVMKQIEWLLFNQ